MSELKKNWRWKLPFLLFLVVATILIIRNAQDTTPFQKEEGFVFGTTYHITYQSDSSMRYSIERELAKVDASLSTFNKQSVISRINRDEAVAVDSLFAEVFSLAQYVSQETGGGFDITVAPLVNAWGFGFKNQDRVTAAQIDSLRQLVGYSKVRLEGNRVVKDDPRIMLDCAAIAKGFGSDVVARMMDRMGVKNYMIEIGGEIVTNGHNPMGNPWCIGINEASDDSLAVNNQLVKTLEVNRIGMATSGNYRNFYYRDGKKYAHTIDPHTGYPVQHSILSSTVLADNCATADAYATAFMVLGLDSAKAVLARHPELQAFFIYADAHGLNQTWATDGLNQ